MSAAKMERLLRSWGATRIATRRADDYVSIDFHTPFPGDQPIRSSVQLGDGGVVEATLRYGVLEKDYFPTHPTEDNGAIQRLRGIVAGDDMPTDGYVLVNYGDTHREPRPHVLYGWAPTGAIEMSELEYLQRGEVEEPVDIEDFMGWITRVGRGIRREFRGEWVND